MLVMDYRYNAQKITVMHTTSVVILFLTKRVMLPKF